MHVTLALASNQHLPALLPLVRAYHAFEGITLGDAEREQALRPLLGESERGRVWLIDADGEIVGYLIACFGYSVEFGGCDAFIDEFFIAGPFRRRGIGGLVLREAKSRLAALGIKAIHLEVARDNAAAQHFYDKLGFHRRERFTLMSTRL